MKVALFLSLLLGVAFPAHAGCGPPFPDAGEWLVLLCYPVAILTWIATVPAFFRRRPDLPARLARRPRAWCAVAGGILLWPLTLPARTPADSLIYLAATLSFLTLVIPLSTGVLRARAVTCLAAFAWACMWLVPVPLSAGVLWKLTAAAYLVTSVVPHPLARKP